MTAPLDNWREWTVVTGRTAIDSRHHEAGGTAATAPRDPFRV